MTVISVSLTIDLLERLDNFVDSAGYSSRSEALRLAIRDSLNQYSLQRMEKGMVMSTVTIISESHQATTHVGLMNLRNNFDELIFGNMHLHIEGGYCIEIFLVKGESDDVMDFISKSKAISGVMEVNYTLTPMSSKS
ncbi:MAG: CopG family ribbon-helix-helix protein [Candidatus Bathyarchaeota archaeon]|nr:CopG family ribbon-helix-helix protein [Candidatus Bathyarchaeota archaeon]